MGFSFRLVLAAVAGIGSANFGAAADAQGAGPAADRSSRELLVAHDAMRNERIDTIDKGQVQLLFADQSSLSIAPGSDVVIDEFAYDPQTQTGNLAATVTTGLIRYVGGAISNQRDVAFYTPSATVSMRSGIILIKAERSPGVDRDGGKTEVLFLAGDRVCVTARGQSRCTSKFATAISCESGEAPSAPTPVTTEAIQALFSNLQAANRGASPEALAQATGRTTPAAVDATANQRLSGPR